MADEANPAVKKRILVLDDDDSVRELTVQYLNKFGYEPLQAQTSSEVRAMLFENLDERKPIDLFITDMSGEHNRNTKIDLLQELKAQRHYLFRTEKPQVIVVTGGAGDIPWLPENDLPVLLKPYRPAELKAAIEERLGC